MRLPGSALHVVRRDNVNGAWAKSRHSRTVPVDRLVMQAHDQYYLLVAYARAYDHVVVTHEQPNPVRRNRVIIPDDCSAMGVTRLNPFEIMRRTGDARLAQLSTGHQGSPHGEWRGERARPSALKPGPGAFFFVAVPVGPVVLDDRITACRQGDNEVGGPRPRPAKRWGREFATLLFKFAEHGPDGLSVGRVWPA
jgi:hypothetical protein